MILDGKDGLSDSTSKEILYLHKKIKCPISLYTLTTVQWYNDADSHGRGQTSLLGTPEGTFPGTPKDIAVHNTTIRGTP